VRAGPNSEQKISRTRWIDSIRIRLKFGLIDVTYINTDSDADSEKYGVFTQFDGHNAPYRYRANLLVDDIEVDPDEAYEPPPLKRVEQLYNELVARRQIQTDGFVWSTEKSLRITTDPCSDSHSRLLLIRERESAELRSGFTPPRSLSEPDIKRSYRYGSGITCRYAVAQRSNNAPPDPSTRSPPTKGGAT
jgi:hypothetical protein